MAEFKVPPVPAGDAGMHPKKCIKSAFDMSTWERSQAYYDIVGFINGISVAIQGKRVNSEIHVSENMQKLLKIIEKLEEYIDETPPLEQPQRFGNLAYRVWFGKMQDNIYPLVHGVLPDDQFCVINELVSYLTESFGNATRVDYGTGHELAFVMFLCCLFKINVLVEEDNVACALKLFNNYLLLVRRLQITYRMEPAGSQGVWSLDDYQFVPFIWGSAQLALNSPFDPSQFLDQKVLDKYKEDYIYIGCIDFIGQVKTGHFAEHSNQLWSISAVTSWAKINSGLVKMYQKEILAKFPVAQHILFGTLMPFKVIKPGTLIQTARLGLVPIPPEVIKAAANKQSTLAAGVSEKAAEDSNVANNI